MGDPRPAGSSIAIARRVVRRLLLVLLIVLTFSVTGIWIGSYWFWVTRQVGSQAWSERGSVVTVSTWTLSHGRFERTYRYTELSMKPEHLRGQGVARLNNVARWNWGPIQSNMGTSDSIGYRRHWYPSYERRGPDGMIRSLLSVPLWAPAVVCYALFVPAAWGALRRYRSAVRGQFGYCRGCGFDLRATPEKCPECGLDVIAPGPR